MNMREVLGILVIIMLAIFLGAYLFGISILRLIDYKMNDISINMPKINIAPQPYTNNNYDNMQFGGGISVNPPSVKVKSFLPQSTKENFDDVIQSNLIGEYVEPVAKYINDFFPSYPARATAPTPTPTTNVPATVVETVPVASVPLATVQVPATPATTVPVATVPVATVPVATVQVPATPSTTVQVPVTTVPVATVPVATVSTYYKDPSLMTVEQKIKFKARANFSKMTLQDYLNWLSLFRNDIAGLTKNYPEHLTNFQKYISGMPITQADLAVIVQSDPRANAFTVEEVEGDAYAVFDRQDKTLFASYPKSSWKAL